MGSGQFPTSSTNHSEIGACDHYKMVVGYLVRLAGVSFSAECLFDCQRGFGFQTPNHWEFKKNNVPNLLLETEELTPIDPINYSNASFVRATVEIGLVNLVCHILLYPKYPWPSQHDIFFIKVSMISVAPLTYRVYMTFALTFINGDIYILTYIP